MNLQADADLVKRAKAGDRTAFDRLVGPLIDHAFRLAFGMLRDREAAEDAVQEAAFKAWRKLANLRSGTEMRPWFLGIVANQCRSTIRGRWWSVLRLEVPTAGAVDQFEDRIASGEEIRVALGRLSPEHREVLILHYYLDLPLDEVAAVARIPVGTVKSRMNRALLAMRPFFQIPAVEALT